jgi:hypothetical protein
MRLEIRLFETDISRHKDMVSLAVEIYQELFNSIDPGIMRGARFIIFPLYPFRCMLTIEDWLKYSMFNAKPIKMSQMVTITFFFISRCHNVVQILIYLL